MLMDRNFMMKKNGKQENRKQENRKQENRKQENRKQKAAVIFTGGTIGSRIGNDGWISPNQEQPYALISLFQKTYPELAEEFHFDNYMPYQILSEQLNADYMNRLIREVAQLLEQADYQAIIICHGTDTLQYSAAVLGIAFQNSRIPIYLVSSNYPLELEKANGLTNFLCAVRHSKLQSGGVMVPYRNSDGNTYLHAATWLLAHQTFEDNLFSMHQEYMGFYDRSGVWVENEKWMEENIERSSGIYQNIQSEYWKDVHKAGRIPQVSRNSGSVLWLRVHPGMSWEKLTGEAHYVMLESYHSGTLCIDEGLQELLTQTRERNIPVYVTGVERVTDSYETIRHYEELGLIPITNVTPVTMYCLLWLKAGNDD
jgi:L-asparaginase